MRFKSEGDPRVPGPGRPKGSYSLTTKLRRILSEECKGYDDRGDRVIELAVQAAENGDASFFKEIFNRIDGKVPDETIIVNRIQVEVVHVIASKLPVALEAVGVTKEKALPAIKELRRLLKSEN